MVKFTKFKHIICRLTNIAKNLWFDTDSLKINNYVYFIVGLCP